MMNHATSEPHDESAVTDVPETTRVQDLLALVKMGIVNSNTLTVFTGFWLALHFNGLNALEHLDKMFFTIVGSALIMAGSCSLNNYIDRDIDHLMERTKKPSDGNRKI
ncbi:UbiA family prenyltransferase [Bacillus cytotoxicus]